MLATLSPSFVLALLYVFTISCPAMTMDFPPYLLTEYCKKLLIFPVEIRQEIVARISDLAVLTNIQWFIDFQLTASEHEYFKDLVFFDQFCDTNKGSDLGNSEKLLIDGLGNLFPEWKVNGLSDACRTISDVWYKAHILNMDFNNTTEELLDNCSKILAELFPGAKHPPFTLDMISRKRRSIIAAFQSFAITKHHLGNKNISVIKACILRGNFWLVCKFLIHFADRRNEFWLDLAFEQAVTSGKVEIARFIANFYKPECACVHLRYNDLAMAQVLWYVNPESAARFADDYKLYLSNPQVFLFYWRKIHVEEPFAFHKHFPKDIQLGTQIVNTNDPSVLAMVEKYMKKRRNITFCSNPLIQEQRFEEFVKANNFKALTLFILILHGQQELFRDERDGSGYQPVDEHLPLATKWEAMLNFCKDKGTAVYAKVLSGLDPRFHGSNPVPIEFKDLVLSSMSFDHLVYFVLNVMPGNERFAYDYLRLLHKSIDLVRTLSSPELFLLRKQFTAWGMTFFPLS